MPTETITVSVIAAVNNNSRYRDCIPYFIDFWQAMDHDPGIRFIPHVFTIGFQAKMPSKYQTSLHMIPIDSNLSDVFLSQIIRLLLPSLSKSELVMTSDIDMVPLGRKYFDFGADLTLKEDGIIAMRRLSLSNEIPICYLMGSPKNWDKLVNKKFPADNSILQTAKTIFRAYAVNHEYSGVRGSEGWNIDQRFIFDCVRDSPQGVKIVQLSDDETGFRRLDRLYHNGLKKWLGVGLVLIGKFSDYHLHLPVNKHRGYVKLVLLAVRIQRMSRRIANSVRMKKDDFKSRF